MSEHFGVKIRPAIVLHHYPGLAHIPFIVSSQHGYHRLTNSYLIELGLGAWGAKSGGRDTVGRARTARTMRTYAEWLANFLEWCDVNSANLYTCTYQNHVRRYQKDMTSGAWSRGGKELSGKTANYRAQQVCDFLAWMHWKGHRCPFIVPYTEKQVSLRSHADTDVRLAKTVRIREGQADKSLDRPLIPPENEEVRQWAEDVYQTQGQTIGLMCETILRSAIRREELVCLRVNTLPLDRRDWVIANPEEPEAKQLVLITIRYGTKGRGYGNDNGDKIGPERTIQIPSELADLWDEYRKGKRNAALKVRLSRADSPTARRQLFESTVHLFLREEDGLRFSGEEIYRRWTKIKIGRKSWSPHKGRHWWACSILWDHIAKNPTFTDVRRADLRLVRDSAEEVIRLIIQPQLGHSDSSTTEKYLRWIMAKLGQPITMQIKRHGKNSDDLERRYQY